MHDQFELEEAAVYDAYMRGEIDNAELNKRLRDLERDRREDAKAAAEEAARRAYDEEIERW